MKIRIGIYGYGNLGRGVESSVLQNKDMELVGVFTRRLPKNVTTLFDTPVYNAKDIGTFKDKIDVLIVCGGSATDLPIQTPFLAEMFNVVDSFDTHANIPAHFDNVDRSSRLCGTTSMISVGWDPGIFSLGRLYSETILPEGNTYTFWGEGVSQGHSDAIRRIEGVADAKQYTIPVPATVEKVRAGSTDAFSAREMHTRECYVVVKDGADKSRIEREIIHMPNYFENHKTTVAFVSQEVLNKDFSGYPHGGTVIRAGKTGVEGKSTGIIEFSLKLDSNPEFTASVLVAYARAITRLHNDGVIGCLTVYDIPPKYLTTKSDQEIIKNLL